MNLGYDSFKIWNASYNIMAARHCYLDSGVLNGLSVYYINLSENNEEHTDHNTWGLNKYRKEAILLNPKIEIDKSTNKKKIKYYNHATDEKLSDAQNNGEVYYMMDYCKIKNDINCTDKFLIKKKIFNNDKYTYRTFLEYFKNPFKAWELWNNENAISSHPETNEIFFSKKPIKKDTWATNLNFFK
tara:strand:- start:302 stop:859 length:558 start_codon:yes stop_codon:yes gene_type:complete